MCVQIIAALHRVGIQHVKQDCAFHVIRCVTVLCQFAVSGMLLCLLRVSLTRHAS